MSKEQKSQAALDLSILIATPNGSGSQSPNHILAKALFRSGLPVGAKNIFPSNIAGLPTWFAIRVQSNGYVSMKRQHEIVLAKNPDTYKEDLKKVQVGGFYLCDQEFSLDGLTPPPDVTVIPIPFRDLAKDLSDSIKMRKLLTNTIYLGVLAELLRVDHDILARTLADYFKDKQTVVELNWAALKKGQEFAAQDLAPGTFRHKVPAATQANQNKLFVDGNSAAALGALSGGCTFFSWYPITPATSLAENFNEYAMATRKDSTAHMRFAQVQAEDELSAINMVIGAGWAGSRAMTSTSGPGLSLMAEGAGLSYFAEIPAVIWDVQRAGPSTGLPTRTLQGDLRAAAHLSHGDTEHIVLLPAHPQECFEMAPLAFELAEMYQTLVIVLSDLDIGMNYFVSDEFKQQKSEFRRGKVLSADQLNKMDEFARYRDVDGDGIGYRTLPGTQHMAAAYFTRGTAHNEKSGYSEDSDNFKSLLDRLQKKLAGATHSLPQPVSELLPDADVTLITYGSTEQIHRELANILSHHGIKCDFWRIRALPLAQDWAKELLTKKSLFVIEQNRDGQMCDLLKSAYPALAAQLRSITQYDGLPISPELVAQQILAACSKTKAVLT